PLPGLGLGLEHVPGRPVRRGVGCPRPVPGDVVTGREREGEAERESEAPHSGSRSLRLSSFILSWSPLREILSRRAAWVTLFCVCLRARTISSRSSRLIAALTCSLSPSPSPDDGASTSSVALTWAAGGSGGEEARPSWTVCAPRSS